MSGCLWIYPFRCGQQERKRTRIIYPTRTPPELTPPELNNGSGGVVLCSCVIKPGRAACGGGTPRPSKQGLKPLYDARFFFWVTVSVPKIPFSLDRVFEGGGRSGCLSADLIAIFARGTARKGTNWSEFGKLRLLSHNLGNSPCTPIRRPPRRPFGRETLTVPRAGT